MHDLYIFIAPAKEREKRNGFIHDKTLQKSEIGKVGMFQHLLEPNI
jgi:hypothetical protein